VNIGHREAREKNKGKKAKGAEVKIIIKTRPLL
jgi:hypothetical protein